MIAAIMLIRFIWKPATLVNCALRRRSPVRLSRALAGIAGKVWDRDGVDAEIIFGILGVASRVRDHEAANEMLRIYNDWLKDFCSHYPDRQIGLACLPYGDIDAAVECGS